MSESRTLFPPECIYCNKIEIKTAGKTERPIYFTLNSAWQPIKSQAETLGKTSFARKVMGIDLCSVEAKHHASCHRRFKNEHHNFIRTQERAKASITQTEQVHITALAKSRGSDHATALMGIHTFTGDDCNCAFRGKGKVGPLKKLQKYPQVPEGVQRHWVRLEGKRQVV